MCYGQLEELVSQTGPMNLPCEENLHKQHLRPEWNPCACLSGCEHQNTSRAVFVHTKEIKHDGPNQKKHESQPAVHKEDPNSLPAIRYVQECQMQIIELWTQGNRGDANILSGRNPTCHMAAEYYTHATQAGHANPAAVCLTIIRRNHMDISNQHQTPAKSPVPVNPVICKTDKQKHGSFLVMLFYLGSPARDQNRSVKGEALENIIWSWRNHVTTSPQTWSWRWRWANRCKQIRLRT